MTDNVRRAPPGEKGAGRHKTCSWLALFLDNKLSMYYFKMLFNPPIKL